MWILSCSQAGVAVGTGSETTQASAALQAMNLRPFDVGGRDSSGHLIVVGGVPGKSGEVACVSPAPGNKGATPHPRKKIAGDVVYCVAQGACLLAVGCADGRIMLLNADLEIQREAHRHTAPCRDVCISPDDRLLASGGRDGLVIVSPLEGGESVVLQDHTAGVECVAFSREGLLASGALDGKVRIHEGKSLRRTYQKLGAEVLSLAYSHRWKPQLFAGLADGRVLELDPDSARHSVVAQLDSAVFSMAALDNKLVLGLDGEVRVLDLSKTESPSAR